MPLLKFDQACLAFGHVPLLDRVNFLLDKGERVALIGRNGTGKSSFLAALSGDKNLDEGQVWRQPGLRLTYVSQEPCLDADKTVFETVASGIGEISRKLSEYHQITRDLEANIAEHEHLLARLQRVQHDLDALNAWNWQTSVEQAIAQFGLEAGAKTSALSGGKKKCLALARAIAASPDVLLLDEPTNHLDIETIQRLENFLLESRLTLCFVTHDRNFLDNLATRIIELDRGNLANFPGNFAEYQRKKEKMLKEENVLDRKFDKRLKEEEAWIRKGVEARRTRAVFRVRRLEKLRHQREERRERLSRVRMRLDSGEKSGELVAELKDVNKAFGSQVIVQNFSMRVLRGDKIGLIGANGIGKTTLLRLLLGAATPDSGSIRQGKHLEIAYFDQFREGLAVDKSLAEVISPGSDYVEIGGVKKHVVGYLEDFLFAPERSRSPVKSLSGGERNRLLLARLFARPANVLVLDEPTNDLDMETLELLEQLLQDYEGTLFLVSHDRAFLDNVVTQVLAAEGGGVWREYAGGYSDWLACKMREIAANASENADKFPVPRQESSLTRTSQALKPMENRVDKLSWKEQRELEALPDQIAALEAEQKELAGALEDPGFYQRSPEIFRAAAERLEIIEKQLLIAMKRWEELETLAESFQTRPRLS